MNFIIYIPNVNINQQRGKVYPVLYCLGGLGSNYQNFCIKSGFANYAKKHRIAVVFPDTSPRNTNIANIADDWEFG